MSRNCAKKTKRMKEKPKQNETKRKLFLPCLAPISRKQLYRQPFKAQKYGRMKKYFQDVPKFARNKNKIHSNPTGKSQNFLTKCQTN